jgi:hypothetical protein
MTSDLPKDLAGWQNVRFGRIENGDMIAWTDGSGIELAGALIGSAISEDGTASRGDVRVYRRIPVPTQTDGKDFSNPQADASCERLPDSGARTSFETGAVRDAASGKGWPHAIPPIAIRKLAKRFEDGGLKYARNNWMLGISLSRYQDAIMRHTLAHAEGQTDEDHLGAVLWNAAAWAWTEQAIADGRLPKTLDDLPFRNKP